MKKLKISEEEYEIRFANWIKMIIDLVKPTNLVFIGGRGTAKSTDIIAERSIDVIHEMPGAPLAFVSDTYVNLMTNIVPAVLQGWRRKKFHEDIHYVIDTAPPASFEKHYQRTINYKHTISTWNGAKFYLLSLDRPSISAGISVVHHFIDETKYALEKKMNKLTPTLRGDPVLFGHSQYYLGQTMCTDMPDPNVNENDWMLKLQKNMDVEQIIRIIQTALVVNDIHIELVNAKNEGKPTSNIEKNLERWTKRLGKIRRNSTFFYEVSSFANVDILTIQYFIRLLENLDIDEFKTSVLSIRPTLAKGARFYANLAPKHFYSDGYNYEYYDQFGLKDNIKQTSAGLKYVKHDEHLEAGFDAGNMMSLAIGQLSGNTYRVLKDLYALTPEWIEDLAKKFTDFFEPHKHKVLHLYYDRSANQYSKSKQDFATKLKYAIENKVDKDGKKTKTGWKVMLMSIGQGNITHAQEFDLMTTMMGERDRRLPILQIDMYECKTLKSSMELAKVKKDPNTKRIKKDKSSEKLPTKRLPLESTNMSDAFKYLICRKKWLAIASRKTAISMGSVDLR
jgi:hypothetical protein